MSTSTVAVHVVIAVKGLADAKTRLARDFAPADRRELVLAMFRDTLSAARAAEQVASVSVVTPDDAVAATALTLGAAVFPEPAHADDTATGSTRLNSAIGATADRLRRGGARHLLALQADLPAVTSAELSAVIAAAPIGTRSFVADHQTFGTAALLVRSGTLDLAPEFGIESARRHLVSGATALTGDWPGLRLDVDTTDDLELAYRLGVGAHTRSRLAQVGWSPRHSPEVHRGIELTNCHPIRK